MFGEIKDAAVREGEECRSQNREPFLLGGGWPLEANVGGNQSLLSSGLCLPVEEGRRFWELPLQGCQVQTGAGG